MIARETILFFSSLGKVKGLCMSRQSGNASAIKVEMSQHDSLKEGWMLLKSIPIKIDSYHGMRYNISFDQLEE